MSGQSIKEVMSIQEFYQLQVERPNPNACELFWTGRCGTPPPKALYELGIPSVPPPGKNCEKCEAFRNLKVLADFAREGYEIEFDGKNYFCTRTIYLDDGYGVYGSVCVEVVINKKGRRKGITVNGMTKSQIEQEIDKNLRSCPFWKEKGMCAYDLETTDSETLETGDCGTCRFLEMCLQLAEQLEDFV